MDIPIKMIVYLIGGVLLLGISLLLYTYFKGGTDITLASLLGSIRLPW